MRREHQGVRFVLTSRDRVGPPFLAASRLSSRLGFFQMRRDRQERISTDEHVAQGRALRSVFTLIRVHRRESAASSRFAPRFKTYGLPLLSFRK
jgi:hypothetical protein